MPSKHSYQSTLDGYSEGSRRKTSPQAGNSKRKRQNDHQFENEPSKKAKDNSSHHRPDQAKSASIPPADDDTKGRFTVDEAKGDLFAAAPKNAVLIHACNCQGSWGGGIALAFRKKYPKAFKKYQEHCQPHVIKRTTRKLLGTAQLIPPVDDDDEGHFIGCLFTSDRYGRARDSPSEILEATGASMRTLLSQVDDWNQRHEEAERIRALYMCKINSGLFSVPWEDTKVLLENLDAEIRDVEPVFMVRDRS